MPDYLFFKSISSTFSDLDPKNDKDKIEDIYYDALTQYQNGVKALRNFDLKKVGDSKITAIDNERKRLHDQIKQLGQLLGKSEQEVYAEIIILNHDLKEYELPEFKLISRDELNEARMEEHFHEIASQNTDLSEDEESYTADWEEVADINDEGKELTTVFDLKKGEFGIIFERHVSKAVRTPNPEIITTRGTLVDMDTHGTQERIRRAKRFAADQGLKLLHYGSFAHEYTEDTFAVVVNEESLGKAVDAIKRSRSEYGIRLTDMDQVIIEKDWEEYKKAIDEQLNNRIELGPFAQMIYEHEWKQAHEPGYRGTDLDIIKEIQKQGYELRGTSIVRSGEQTEHLTRKQRRKQEREQQMEDDYPESEKNPFKFR